MKSMLPAEMLDWTIVESAGTIGLCGTPPAEGAIIAAAESGVDISGYRSTPLEASLLAEADLILAMEAFHKEWIVRICPEAEEKTYLLGEFNRGNIGPKAAAVGDPIGCSVEVYRDCYKAIQKHIVRCLPAIEDLAKRKQGG